MTVPDIEKDIKKGYGALLSLHDLADYCGITRQVASDMTFNIRDHSRGNCKQLMFYKDVAKCIFAYVNGGIYNG